MIPKITCSSCGNELSLADKFCSKCGSQVLWSSIDEQEKGTVSRGDARPETSVVVCSLCGTENSFSSAFCEGCGATLAGSSEKEFKSKPAFAEPSKGVARKPTINIGKSKRAKETFVGKGLEGWKVIALIGGFFVITLVVIGLTRNRELKLPSQQPSSSRVSPTLIQDIEQLRSVVEANPSDMVSTLKLANLLHDGKFFDQAIIYYKKYLALNEQDANAHVDLGICYFENHDVNTAIAEMEKALRYNPKHQFALFNLGIVNLGSGNTAKAIDWFKKCIEVAPSSEIAEHARQLLTQHSTSTNNLKLN